MITEDYVNFETAKLLKEKGFNEKCGPYYGLSGTLMNGVIIEAKHNVDGDKFSAPTLQMAMKWLREVHRLSIEPLVDYGHGDEFWWYVNIAKIKKDGLIDTLTAYGSYEEACEAAIKYCLENLI